MSPRMLSLQEAVHEIIVATKPRPWETRQAVPVSPFFFIVGAGISYPSIPLAGGIEKLCREEIERQGRPLPPQGKTAMERYEGYFQGAFPHPEDRRAFLHHHIKSAPISAANFRLAHLVGSGKLTNLVVTTNFDELLTKALRLFGEDVIVCDHPKTTQRIDPKRDDIQVIHVHGTHWFYDCCNLKQEIEHRAQDDREDHSSMGHLLDRVLFDRTPLVVGYSGWEGDVVMAALKRRLYKQQLRYNLYWFCFKRTDVDAFPGWLKEHGNVRFVVPLVAPTAERDESARASFGNAEDARITSLIPADITGDSKPKEPVLLAQQVFDALIRGLELKEPRLTHEPLDFFAEQLRKNLVAQDVQDEDDIYLIRQVVRSVEDGAKLARREAENKSQAQKENTALLELVSRAVRGAAYAEAFEAARKIDLGSLSVGQREDMEVALEAISLSASDLDAEAKLAACELRVRLAEVARTSGDSEHAWLLCEVEAIFGKGYFLVEIGRLLDAVAAYDEIIRRIGESTEPALKEEVAKALVNKGAVLEKSGEKEEAIKSCEEVIRRFGESTESALLKDAVAKALINKGRVLEESGKKEEAIKSYEEVIMRFSESSELALKGAVARALVYKGCRLRESRKNEEALKSYDEVIHRFGESTDPMLKERVAVALLFKGSMLGLSGRTVEALKSYEEVIRRFGESTDPVLKERVALAIEFKTLESNEDDKR